MSDAGQQECAGLIAQETQASATPVLATEATQDLKDCLAGADGDFKMCSDSQGEAKTECVDRDAETKETKALANAGKGLYIANKAGSGAQEQCFAASVAANMGMKAFDAARDRCDTSIKTCDSNCSTKKVEDLEKSCREKIGTAPATQAINQQYFDAKMAEHKKNMNDKLATCTTGDVEKGKSMISDALASVGTALRDSMTCMCKLSNSGASGASCDEIVPPSDCLTNPEATGCAAYGGINTCTPGAGYDAKLCSCQTNSKGAGCPGAVSGTLANFASGPQINNAGRGDTGFGTTASNLKPSGDVDLSGVNGAPNGAAGN
ncbi:MAG: hypothetical protein ABL876_19350, partial [Chitinophagaceae bacterium]